MNLWRRWVCFLSRKEVGTSLALFRILVGLSVCVTIGSVWSAGLVDMLWYDVSEGGYRNFWSEARDAYAAPWLVRLMGGPVPQVVWSLVLANFALGVLLILGLGGRLTAFMTLQGTLALLDLNTHTGGSYDALLQNALWLLVLSPSTVTLSLDCRIRNGTWWNDCPVMAWPRYLVVFQIILVYFSTGLQKVSSYWVPGGEMSALYYIMQQPSWQRFDMSFLAHVYPLTQGATLMTWCWEVLAPLWWIAFVFSMSKENKSRLARVMGRYRVRLVFALIGVVFHILLFIFMNLGPFSIISLSFYACLVHPHEYREWYGRVRNMRRRI